MRELLAEIQAGIRLPDPMTGEPAGMDRSGSEPSDGISNRTPDGRTAYLADTAERMISPGYLTRRLWMLLKEADSLKATEATEEHNSILERVLVSIDFNLKNKRPEKKLWDLLSHFSEQRSRNEDLDRLDLQGWGLPTST